MANFQGRRGSFLTPRVRAWIAIAVLSALCFLLSRGAWGIYRKNKVAETNRAAAAAKLADIEARERYATKKLSKIKTAQGLEEEIRLALPVAKEGEHLITIIDQKNAGDDEATTSNKAGFWSKLFAE